MDLNSYQAAGLGVPWKMLANKEACVQDGLIKPVHIQFIPTNKCNGNCTWCSCKGVDRGLEMPWKECKQCMFHFALKGTKAMTITGGGEPTIHPEIQKILIQANDYGIKTSIVTNGLKWGREKDIDLTVPDTMLEWLRISVVDTVGSYDTGIIHRICQRLPNVDIGVSFTVTKDVNLDIATQVCHAVKENSNITHVRFVQDLMDISKESSLAMLEVSKITGHITNKAIYQYRTDFNIGASPCYVSHLRPVIDASGFVYPCCGVQYAKRDKLGYMPAEFHMCHWREFNEHLAYFDGSICQCCYYNHYNVALDKLVSNYQHKDFV
jgi:MoaA/NifB/PqqE/SkfB family radical SAM enzyme